MLGVNLKGTFFAVQSALFAVQAALPRSRPWRSTVVWPREVSGDPSVMDSYFG